MDLSRLHAGRWGATSAHDGVAGASHALSNTGNIPIEAIEGEYPVRVSRYELLADTGGTGRFGGAPASAASTRCGPTTWISDTASSARHSPSGPEGGDAGAGARCLVKRPAATGRRWRRRVTVLNTGDCFRMELPAGAGFGPVARAPAEDVSAVADGLLSGARRRAPIATPE